MSARIRRVKAKRKSRSRHASCGISRLGLGVTVNQMCKQATSSRIPRRRRLFSLAKPGCAGAGSTPAGMIVRQPGAPRCTLRHGAPRMFGCAVRTTMVGCVRDAVRIHHAPGTRGAGVWAGPPWVLSAGKLRTGLLGARPGLVILVRADSLLKNPLIEMHGWILGIPRPPQGGGRYLFQQAAKHVPGAPSGTKGQDRWL